MEHAGTVPFHCSILRERDLSHQRHFEMEKGGSIPKKMMKKARRKKKKRPEGSERGRCKLTNIFSDRNMISVWMTGPIISLSLRHKNEKDDRESREKNRRQLARCMEQKLDRR